jgi:hypothetical protein
VRELVKDDMSQQAVPAEDGNFQHQGQDIWITHLPGGRVMFSVPGPGAAWS